MYKIKVPARKRLTEPDEFVGLATRLVQFLRDRLTLFASAVGAVLLVGLVAGGYRYYRLEAEAEPQSLYTQAGAYARGMLTSTGVVGRDLRRAAATYRVIVERFPSSRVAPLAQFYAGATAAEMQDYAAAVQDHEEFLRRYPKAGTLVPFAYQQLGYARLARGELPEALKAFQTVLSLDQALNKDQAYEEIGRLYLTLGQRQAALETYQELIKQFPDSPLATEATVVVKGLTAALESTTR